MGCSSHSASRSRFAWIPFAFAAVLLAPACTQQTTTVEEQDATRLSRDAIARVLGAEIVPSDLIGATDQERCRTFASRVAGALFEAYRRDENIEATDAEIAECQAALTRPNAKAPLSRTMARSLVIQYKIDRALYCKYGGEVIFQQASPFQPVGAYRAFLKEQERTRRFEILDDHFRTCFWEQFSARNSSVLAKETVDFSRPWWKTMQR